MLAQPQSDFLTTRTCTVHQVRTTSSRDSCRQASNEKRQRLHTRVNNCADETIWRYKNNHSCLHHSATVRQRRLKRRPAWALMPQARVMLRGKTLTKDLLTRELCCPRRPPLGKIHLWYAVCYNAGLVPKFVAVPDKESSRDGHSH